MSDRIVTPSDLPAPGSSWQHKKWWLNGLVVAVVIFISGLLVWFSRELSFNKTTLEGDGCQRTEKTEVICKLVTGQKESVLRSCSSEENCSQSEYQLGKKEGNSQYILYISDVFAPSIQVTKVDLESMDSSLVDQAFYTEPGSDCQASNGSYSADCFSIPTTEAQRKDIWEQNQKYQNLTKKYQ